MMLQYSSVVCARCELWYVASGGSFVRVKVRTAAREALALANAEGTTKN